MELLDQGPSVSSDGQTVRFVLHSRGCEYEFAITVKVLEQHFWLLPHATQHKVLRTFEDGRKRIVAAAERKLLVHPDGPLILTDIDFAR